MARVSNASENKSRIVTQDRDRHDTGKSVG